MLFTMSLIIKDLAVTSLTQYWIGFMFGGIVFLFLFNVILHNGASIVFKGIFHWIFLIPTYINIFLIFAICNMHDISWEKDTEPLKMSERARLDEYEEFRAKWVIVWITCNSGMAY